jgi:hypothetical protein
MDEWITQIMVNDFTDCGWRNLEKVNFENDFLRFALKAKQKLNL